MEKWSIINGESLSSLILRGNRFLSSDSVCKCIMNSKNVVELDLSGLELYYILIILNRCDDNVLKAITDSMSLLESLNINLTSITDEGIDYMCNSTFKLKYLSLSNCSNISDKSLSRIEDAYCKSILDICIYGCYNITDKGLMHVCFCYMYNYN